MEDPVFGDFESFPVENGKVSVYLRETRRIRSTFVRASSQVRVSIKSLSIPKNFSPSLFSSFLTLCLVSLFCFIRHASRKMKIETSTIQRTPVPSQCPTSDTLMPLNFPPGSRRGYLELGTFSGEFHLKYKRQKVTVWSNGSFLRRFSIVSIFGGEGEEKRKKGEATSTSGSAPR